MFRIRFQRIDKEDTNPPPTRAHPGDAGLDLTANENVTIPAGEGQLVKTGFRCALPEGTYGRVASRSGLSVKKGIEVGAGVVDRTYRGPLCVQLWNHGGDAFEVKYGERIAQFIVTKIDETDVLLVENLEDTERGEGGFGSTGV